MRTRTGIFGGTFDPIHSGHVKIARSFLKSNVISELIVLPAPMPPHKTDEQRTGYNHRMEMARLAFEEIQGITVSDLEKQLPGPSYSLQTIEHLEKESPDRIFFLCIGQDSAVNFTSWYEYKKILGLVSLVVAERPDSEMSEIEPEVLERSIFVDHNPINISSTEIRNLLNSNRFDDILMPDKVVRYIRRYNLYQDI